VSEPYAISVDDIAFAIVSNFANSTIPIKLRDISAVDAFGLTCESHHPTQFVQRCFRAMVKRGQNITKVDRVVSVPFEVGSHRKTNRRHFMDHRTVS
jgi:hypothetical protein